MRTVRQAAWRAVLIPVVLVATLAWAALRICPRCGYEATPEDAVCSHCGAKLPATKPPPDETEPPPTPPPEPDAVDGPEDALPDGVVPRAVVAEQLKTARTLFEQQAYWPALLFARNAFALLALYGEEGAPLAARTAMLMQQARAALAAVERTCPVCEGSGRRKIQTVTLKGELIVQEVPGANCPVCGGRGALRGCATAAEWNADCVRVEQLYAIEQRRRGLDAYRGIWLPFGTVAKLGVREQTALLKAFGTWCPACRGFGLYGCEACGGTGKADCPNAACVQGVEICPDCQGRGRLKSTSGSTTLSSRCETCRSTGRRTCPTCEGAGFVACSPCEGAGRLTCTTCGGRGTPAVCTKCLGEGWQPCTRCGGTGTYRDGPCPYCGGNGAALCSACMGTGHDGKR